MGCRHLHIHRFTNKNPADFKDSPAAAWDSPCIFLSNACSFHLGHNVGRGHEAGSVSTSSSLSTRCGASSKRGGPGLPCVLPTGPGQLLTACSHAVPDGGVSESYTLLYSTLLSWGDGMHSCWEVRHSPSCQYHGGLASNPLKLVFESRSQGLLGMLPQCLS